MLEALLSAAVLLAQAAGPADGGARKTDTAAPPAPAASAEKTLDEKDPVICTNQPVVGSLFPHKVCARKSTRDKASRDGRELTESIQRQKPFFTTH